MRASTRVIHLLAHDRLRTAPSSQGKTFCCLMRRPRTSPGVTAISTTIPTSFVIPLKSTAKPVAVPADYEKHIALEFAMRYLCEVKIIFILKKCTVQTRFTVSLSSMPTFLFVGAENKSLRDEASCEGSAFAGCEKSSNKMRRNYPGQVRNTVISPRFLILSSHVPVR